MSDIEPIRIAPPSPRPSHDPRPNLMIASLILCFFTSAPVIDTPHQPGFPIQPTIPNDSKPRDQIPGPS